MGFYFDPETLKMGFTKWRASRAKLVSRWSEGKSNLATFCLTRLRGEEEGGIGKWNQMASEIWLAPISGLATFRCHRCPGVKTSMFIFRLLDRMGELGLYVDFF